MHLPRLPLEAVLARSVPGLLARDTGIAVFENRQGIRRVLLANASAEKLGVKPGLPVNAALALAPLLELLERSPEKEARALERLAAWAERFTSMVSIEAPDLLLLEIGGSLQLFGDAGSLRQQVERGLEGKSFSPSIAVAPAALAATWLARAGRQVCIEETKSLTGMLGPLPLSCLEWPEPVIEALRGMGICSIGDCLRLPRQGFARRFGAARLLQLDRALGRLPDPRKSYRAPERFCEEHELAEEQSDSELLLEACRCLLSNLEGFLTSRQLEVRQVQFSFFHLRSAATHLALGCMQAGRTTAQWFDLLAIRFERLSLPEPVIAIRLRSGAGQALQAVEGTLFQAHARQSAPISHLLDRLCARMGNDSVHGVTTVAEHRPHYAWNTAEITGSTAHSQSPSCAAPQSYWHAHQSPLLLADIRRTNSLLLRRPLWMLPEPLPLTAEPGGTPVYHGPLKLVNGPERLETGWWDGKGIARDYFVAINTQGIHLWIYRNRKKTTWYLHGIFG